MINPKLKFTGVSGDAFYVDVTKIIFYTASAYEGVGCELSEHLNFERVGVRETVEQVTAMIQKYYDDCLKAQFCVVRASGWTPGVDTLATIYSGVDTFQMYEGVER